MLSRRAALKGGTATVAAIAVSGAVAASSAVDDPVIALRIQRESILAAMDDLPDGPECNELMDAWTETEVAIAEAEPMTFAGALVQLEQLAIWADGGKPYAGAEAVKRLIEVLPERIERLAGRAQS